MTQLMLTIGATKSEDENLLAHKITITQGARNK